MATSNEIRQRISELRRALEDVVPNSYFQRAYNTGSAQHQQLFGAYVDALRDAKTDAEAWWQRMIALETVRIGDVVEAEVNVEMRRPAGSAVSPRVVHEFRKAWLDCDRLNADHNDPVHPFVLTLDWLLDEHHEELAEYLGSLPFLPIALAADGRWI